MGGAKKSWRENLQDYKSLLRVEVITLIMSSKGGRSRNWIVADFEDRLVQPGE
jgi:hypothetical protein